MQVLFKFITEQMINNLKLFDDSETLNIIFSGILLVISFIPAWKITRFLYEIGIIKGKTQGSFVHWSIRLITAGIFFIILQLIVKIIMLIQAHWIQVMLVLILAVILVISVIFYNKKYKEKEK